jgi:mycoredoxin
MNTDVVIYTRPGCPYCYRLRRGLRRRGVPFGEVNIRHDSVAAATVRAHADGTETVPTVRIGGRWLVNPTVSAVSAAAGYPAEARRRWPGPGRCRGRTRRPARGLRAPRLRPARGNIRSHRPQNGATVGSAPCWPGRILGGKAQSHPPEEAAMHPIITRDLMKARITGLHRQVKQNAPFTPAYTIAELTGRALMPLRFHGPSPAPRPQGANTSSPGPNPQPGKPVFSLGRAPAQEPAAARPASPSSLAHAGARIPGPQAWPSPARPPPGSIISMR